MSLHRLLRHLAGVERWRFAINVAGLDLPIIYYRDDQDFDPWGGDPVEALRVRRAECERSREIVDQVPNLVAHGVVPRNGPYSLRWLLLRMITEYARHDGHADLLREATDGAVGA